MPVARPETSDSRVIAHVDLDCFYVQVEQRKQPGLRGKPAAVVQCNKWKGGGLIAVSYEAREFGVKRSMRGDEAKQVCPGIILVRVPVARGKADLSTNRNAESEVVSILARKGTCERASNGKVYLDLTEAARAMIVEAPPERMEHIDKETLKSHVLGLQVEDGDNEEECVRKWLSRVEADHRDKLLACGALIVAELRMQVLAETQFTCSAGIAHNKADNTIKCEVFSTKSEFFMNKPAQQTVVPSSSVKSLLESLPVKKMKQLGGKLGTSLEDDLGVNTVGDLLQFSEETLQNHYGVNTGTWLWNIARGIDGEEVQERLLPKSHVSGKSFPGPRALKTVPSVLKWLSQLCEELNERLDSDFNENKRIAHTLTLHASAYKNNDSDSNKKFPSKSCPLRYGSAKIQEDASNLFQAALREYLGSHSIKQSGWRITELSVSASTIIDEPRAKSRMVNTTKRKRAALKEERGTLLKFLTSCSPASSSSTSAEKYDTGSRPSGDGCSGMRRAEGSLSSNRRDDSSLDQSAGGATWNHYKADEIDPAVVVELPQAIQDEIRTSLGPHRPQKQQNTAKRKSTITDYFLSTTDK